MSNIKLIMLELKKEKQFKLLLSMLIIFAVWVGTNVNTASFHNMTTFEFILYSMCDHYYLIYGYFFFLVFWFSGDIRSTADIELIRLKNKKQYYQLKLQSTIIKTGLFVLGHLAIAFFVSAISLPFIDNFNCTSGEPLYESLSNIFTTPSIGIIIVSLYLWLGSVFLYQLLFYSNEILGKKGYLICVLLMFITTMVGFATNLDGSILAVFFFNNYFLFHHGCLVAGKVAFCIILGVMVCSPFIFIKIALKVQCKSFVKQKLSYIQLMVVGRNSSMVVAVYTLVFLQLCLSFVNKYNYLDFLFINLRGYSHINFNLIEFLFFLSLYVFPIFIICAFWEKEKEFKNNIGEFRYGSRRNWNLQTEKIRIFFLVKYLFLYFGALAVCAILLYFIQPTLSSSFVKDILDVYSVNLRELPILLASCIILKVVEFYFLYLISKIIYRLSKNTIFTFLLCFGGYSLTIFPLKYNNLVPFGTSSLYRMLEYGGENIVYYSIPLFVAIMLTFLSNKYLEEKQWKR